MSSRASFWPLRFARWARRPAQEAGYTVLVPVPGDLPVFLDLSLAVCRLQDSTHRGRTVVIPDRPTPGFAERVAEAAREWPGPLGHLPLPVLDRVVLPRLNDPGRYHGAQLIRGTSRARTSHIVLHDADLFLMDPDVHEDEYRAAVDRDLDALGVSPPWDPWFREQGRDLAATWELCARTDWLRSFPPHRHLGHDAEVRGERHTFDTTFWGQFHTPADRIAVGEGLADRIVHFNYVISTYRRFQQTSGQFHDNGFRILLIRLFVDLFASPGDRYDMPSLQQLADGLGGLGDDRHPVAYGPGDGLEYATLRGKLRQVVSGPWSDAARAAQCLELLDAFDDYYRDPAG